MTIQFQRDDSSQITDSIKDADPLRSDVDALVSDFYLIAGNQQQARDYFAAKGMQYNPRRVFHAPHCLRGKERGLRVRVVGTYYTRLDWDDFSEILASRECVVEQDKY